jgi:hypothetical protein
MAYWIYEHWTAEDKAVIHAGACGLCNNGRGCHPNPRGNRNGRWIGPFRSKVDAERAARATKRRMQKQHSCVK